MRAIRPRVDGPTVTLAEDQEEYKPITVALQNNTNYPCDARLGYNGIIAAYLPNEKELKALNEGKAIHIHMLTFGRPMMPIHVEVEGCEYD